ncbi:OLC1v1013362C1 [Oldenlandia corymbosa var. corymbosa]|uniref:OLC1v1013362C1 n=1 Tax=Oldenlandia corymbosa var. corymbosa TaxID=529605 RepID=A0AAV1E067_OLDCO|nr:OLC1v1013362C1 [Oldenlandia corymbosa var. corymbosa]
MRALLQLVSSITQSRKCPPFCKHPNGLLSLKPYFSSSTSNDGDDPNELTKVHFDGEVVGQQVVPGQAPTTPGPEYGVGGRGGNGHMGPTRWTDEETMKIRELEALNRKGKAFLDSWDDRMRKMSVLMKQIREPGARGSYLKDSEKAEMYRKHKENPEVNTVEKLAEEYRIMR